MRSLRETLAGLLRDRDYEEVLRIARKDRRAVRTLMGILYHEDELVRWRAVTMFGRLAAEEPEMVRPLIWRLLWFLNEESSTVGWGSAQALGEIARTNPGLTKDAVRVVVHFMDDEEVCLPANRNTYLLCGAVWAVGNLARTEPELTGETGPALITLLKDPDPQVRGLSAWALGEMRFGPAGGAEAGLEGLLGDPAPVEIYIGEELWHGTVGNVAAGALGKIRRKS